MKSRTVWLWILLLFLLAGCAGRQKGSGTLGENEYNIYYLNTQLNQLVAVPYEAQSAQWDIEGLITELMEQFLNVPADVEAVSAPGDRVTYIEFTREESIVYLDFDTNYQSMSPAREILTRAALAKTLTQIDGVESISINSGEQPLLDAYGNAVGLITGGDFINSISNINAFEKVTVNLYFADDTGRHLKLESREVFYDVNSSNTSLERLIIDELRNGPEVLGLKATLPHEARVLNITVNEKVCYVNFDAGFMEGVPDVMDYITIYSIVDSLLELPSVNKVQIMVNGSTDVIYNTISLQTSWERNLDYLIEE